MNTTEDKIGISPGMAVISVEDLAQLKDRIAGLETQIVYDKEIKDDLKERLRKAEFVIDECMDIATDGMDKMSERIVDEIVKYFSQDAGIGEGADGYGHVSLSDGCCLETGHPPKPTDAGGGTGLESASENVEDSEPNPRPASFLSDDTQVTSRQHDYDFAGIM